MSQTPQSDLSADLNILSPSASNIILTSPPRNGTRNKTLFQNVPSKILEEVNNEDVQLNVEDNPTAQQYFKPDPEKETEEDIEALKKKLHGQKDTNPYEIGFKPGVFIKFFLMHMLFFCFIGPLIILFTPIVGWPVLKNQEFVGHSRHVFSQTLEYATVVVFIVMYYVVETVGLQAMEVYMLFVCIIIRMITIASKYAYQSELFLRLMHTTVLSEKDLTNDLMLGRWRLQTDEIIREEIQSSILRLEIDSSLFFFNFLGETSPELKAKLSKENKANEKTYSCSHSQEPLEEDRVALCQSMRREANTSSSAQKSRSKWFSTIRQVLSKKNNKQKENDTVNSVETPKDESARVETKPKNKSLFAQNTIAIQKSFMHFTKPQLLESKYLYGYNLILDLRRQARALNYKHSMKVVALVSIIRGLLPTFYRIYLVYYKKEDILIFTDKAYAVSLIFVLNVLFFSYNIATLFIAVQDFRSKVWCFKQLGYLISPKKIHEFKTKKLYPTLNIFDPITLKTWSSMRRIMKDYGKKYILRNNFNITVSMTLYSFILVTFVLQLLGIFKAYNDPLMMIVFGYESIVFFFLFISVMTGVAFLNNQYQVHRNLLKKNKTIIADFARLSHLYVGKDSINPDNMIYKEGLRVLRKELGKEDFEPKLIERGEKLICMIDDIIEELEFEECNEAFTVMGIKVDYKLLQSLALAIVSLLFAVGQSFVNK